MYAYFFDKAEAGYAYKRYAYKKKHVSSVMRQKGGSRKEGKKKTKQVKFFEKRTSRTP